MVKRGAINGTGLARTASRATLSAQLLCLARTASCATLKKNYQAISTGLGIIDGPVLLSPEPLPNFRSYYDQVTLSSLNRHAVATRADVGMPKATCLARHFAEMVPEAEVEAVVEMYTAEKVGVWVWVWEVEGFCPLLLWGQAPPDALVDVVAAEKVGDRFVAMARCC